MRGDGSKQSSAATADAMGFWAIGGIDESTRCARIGFYLYVPRSQSCPGSSATRLLIAAVDLGLSPFRVQAGHEVSLCQAWVSMRTTWEIKGGGWLMMGSEANLKSIRRRATPGRLIRARAGRIRNSVCVLTGCWSLGMLAASRVSAGRGWMSHKTAACRLLESRIPMSSQ
jgi:hypothetical protein